MVVLHYLFLLVHITTAQFPDHIDLQRVGEIIFNNEKYNVLKPTIHKITDHFKDFMLRRENKDKNERVYIDDNGFRHFWSGLGVKSSSLRKTEISLYEVNKNIQIEQENPTGGARDKGDNVDNGNGNIEDATVAVKRKPKRPKTSLEEDREEKTKKEMLRETADTKTAAPPAGAGGKKVAITSFFCPFFGVIKMTSFID